MFETLLTGDVGPDDWRREITLMSDDELRRIIAEANAVLDPNRPMSFTPPNVRRFRGLVIDESRSVGLATDEAYAGASI